MALLESPKPWHNSKGQATTVQMILKNWKEVDIDIKANGKAVLDFINLYRHGEEYNQIKKMLEKEYSLIDVTESVESLNLDQN